MQVSSGHEVEPLAGKADDLRLHMRFVRADDLAAIANGGLAAFRLERQTHHAGEATRHR
jgi:hypothetical protein